MRYKDKKRVGIFQLFLKNLSIIIDYCKSPIPKV